MNSIASELSFSGFIGSGHQPVKTTCMLGCRFRSKDMNCVPRVAQRGTPVLQWPPQPCSLILYLFLTQRLRVLQALFLGLYATVSFPALSQKDFLGCLTLSIGVYSISIFLFQLALPVHMVSLSILNYGTRDIRKNVPLLTMENSLLDFLQQIFHNMFFKNLNGAIKILVNHGITRCLGNDPVTEKQTF